MYDPGHFVLQQLSYLTYARSLSRIYQAFHVKDSEFKPNGKKGAFGGYGDWKIGQGIIAPENWAKLILKQYSPSSQNTVAMYGL